MNTMTLCSGLVALLGLLAGCSRAPAAADATDTGWQLYGDTLVWRGKTAPTTLRIATVGNGDGPATHVAGRIVWNDHVTARVFTPVNGRVEALFVEPGARVHRGQPLLRLASGDFGQWQAELRKAQADAEAARRADERARDLLAAGVIAQRDAEQAQADRQRADAELERAAARLQQLGAQAGAVDGSFELRSPVDGVVVERAASMGTEMRADAAAPLFIITDPDRLNVLIDLPEYVAAEVRPGTEISFVRSGRSGGAGRARLTNVPAEVDPVTRTVRALGVVVSGTSGLPVEAYIQADIPAPAVAGAVHVPADALVLVGSDFFAWVRDGQNYQRRAVGVTEPGAPLVAVNSGLHAGEEVVVDGSLYLEQMFETGRGD
jgi:cobalt-zinc-cadmium efflux system membrane fusion protein